MIDIEIKGSCVSREAFSYQDQVFDQTVFNISNYIFQKPLAAIESKKIVEIEQNVIDQLKLELLNKESVKDFVIRQVDNSFSKNFFNKKKENFIILDFIDERMNLIKLADSFIEYRPEFMNVLRKENIPFEIVKNTKAMFYNYIDKFIASIKKKYHEENIILHKAYALNTTKIGQIPYPLTSTFADPYDKKRINSYSVKRSTSLNLFFLEVYDYIEKNYPKIKIVELPIKDYYSPTNHKYGRGFFHYNDEYYLDFLMKIDSLLQSEKNPLKDKVAQENKDHIHSLEKMQKVISNIYESNTATATIRNPEELLFGPMNSPVKYNINTGGKPLVKSYQLKDSTPGTLIYDNEGEYKAKFIFNKNNELSRIYTFYKNQQIESITSFEENEIVKTDLYDELQNRISERGKTKVISKNTEKIYSFYNDINQIILKVIDNSSLKQKRVIFYADKHISRVIAFDNGKISRIVKYDNEGNLHEEFMMGEFINIGKVQVKLRYSKNKKKFRYMFHASGNLQSKTTFTADERYYKTEYFNEKRELTNERYYNIVNTKNSRIVYHQTNGSKKVVEYFDTGARKSISLYNPDGEIIRKEIRNNEREFFQPLNV